MSLFPTAFAANIIQNTTSRGGSEVNDLMGNVITSVPQWIMAMVITILSFFMASVVKRIVVYRVTNSSKYSYSKEVILLIDRAVYFGIILFGLIAAFGIIGINIVTLLGALGLGLGFAFKDLFSNFIAGVVILTQKKFMIGDKIRINGIYGKIIEIETRTTQVQDFNGSVHIIPNAQLITSVVENITKNSFRRIIIPVGVHYSTPLPQAVKLALNSLKKHDQIVAKPETKVVVTEFGENAIILQIRFWIESTLGLASIRSKVMQDLKKDFDAAGISISYPMRTLTLDKFDSNIMQAFHVPEEKEPYHFAEETKIEEKK